MNGSRRRGSATTVQARAQSEVSFFKAGSADETDTLLYRFRDCDVGRKLTTDIGVYVIWSDVEEMIRLFSDSGHPEAMRLLADITEGSRLRATLGLSPAPEPIDTKLANGTGTSQG